MYIQIHLNRYMLHINVNARVFPRSRVLCVHFSTTRVDACIWMCVCVCMYVCMLLLAVCVNCTVLRVSSSTRSCSCVPSRLITPTNIIIWYIYLYIRTFLSFASYTHTFSLSLSLSLALSIFLENTSHRQKCILSSRIVIIIK